MGGFAGGTCGSLPREGACSFPCGAVGRRRNLWSTMFFSLGAFGSQEEHLGGFGSQEEPVVRCPERAPVLFLEGLSVAGGTCGSRERPRSFLWGPLGRRRNLWGALGRRRNLWLAAQRERLFFSLGGFRSQEEPVVRCTERAPVLFLGVLLFIGSSTWHLLQAVQLSSVCFDHGTWKTKVSCCRQVERNQEEETHSTRSQHTVNM